MRKSVASACVFLLILFAMGTGVTLAATQEEDKGTLSACIANSDGTTCNCMCTYSNGGGIFVDKDKPAAGCGALNGENCEEDDVKPLPFPVPAWFN